MIRTQTFRVNCVHYKELLAQDYLTWKSALVRAAVCAFIYVDRTTTSLKNLVFENREYQYELENARYVEDIRQTSVGEFSKYHASVLVEMIHFVEEIIPVKYPHRASVVFVEIYLDASFHLCLNLRSLS